MTNEREDRPTALAAQLRQTERALPTSGLSRLWKTGRSAAGLGAAVLGGRLRGRPRGLESADLDAVARLVTQLGELKGVAMKAGQILGYVDPTLPEELRAMLSVLQTSSPASSRSAVEAAVREAFGPRAEGLLAGLARAPVAVASIGQVHAATLPSGAKVAVKIRHDGIREALESDFRAATRGCSMASVLMPGGGASAASFIAEARTAMLEECDFALEAERQATFARLFADHDVVSIPAIVPEWCAPSVLTTEWMPGSTLDALLATRPSAAVRDRLGVALFDFYVGALYRHGLFHADPHPGNYTVSSEGRLVVYDFGCVRSFDEDAVAALARLVSAVRRDDAPAMRDAFAALGACPPETFEAQAQLERLLRGFFAPVLARGPRPVNPGAAMEAREVLRDKRALMKLALPGKLLFLFRLRFGLYAVLARLGAVADWATLESHWAEAALAPRPASKVQLSCGA